MTASRQNNTSYWVVPFTSPYYCYSFSCWCLVLFACLGGKNTSHCFSVITLSPLNRSSVIDLESSLSSSENPFLTSGSTKVDSHMQDTSDSRPIKGSAKVVCIPIVFIPLGISLPCRYIILSCPELPLTFAYPTPEFPTPNFEYHTTFDVVVFGTMVKTRKFVERDSTLATKAVWDDELTLIFCELCVNEVNAGNRPTTHLNSKGWENVVALFQAKTQKNYGKPQLKNKWDTLKKEWRYWMVSSKRTVDATEEWWAEKIQENPDFKGYKKKGIEPRLNDLIWQMFGGIVATGENAWAPSSGVLPSGVPMGDDTLNEGFGDSDENSNKNEDIPPNEVPSNPSHETPNRRKETLGVVHGKGKKSSSSRKSSRNSLATHIEKLCESMASPRKSINEIIFPHSEYSISNAMDALRDLEDEIPKKDELYYFAIKIFQIPVKQEVFLNLDPDVRVWWLRREYAEQNPIASFSSLVATSSFPFQPYHPPPPP
ncbi:hypothetical protein GOBAR_AA03722 [Gossypium barbadense]|uniref:Myb/SANT-like domain-containing protein n=1 Tax=Gossypium barbadense TaxID=3634 RepID=A0A2P5YMP3_GOSBA|nr:hypothetical protein GOBAR_AA03722 [Gossypium barbadense]